MYYNTFEQPIFE